LHKAIEQFLADAYWGEPDFMLVDMPPGTGDVTLSLAQVMPRAEVVVVTTPNPPPSGCPTFGFRRAQAQVVGPRGD